MAEDPQGPRNSSSGSRSSTSSSTFEQRRQVLRAVHEQAQLRATGAAGLPAPSRPSAQHQQHEWIPDQWFAAFQFLFYVDDHASSCHDDLIFFIKQPAVPGAPCSTFTVHRKSKAVPADLSISGKAFGSVAWPETVLLNLVLQAHYQLTVTACRQELLSHVAHGLDVSSQVVEVTRPVYASPTQMAVNLATSKVEAEPAPTYPDIFFAVDNYDDVFNDVVLQQGDDCFCVVLKAVLPPPPPQPPNASPADHPQGQPVPGPGSAAHALAAMQQDHQEGPQGHQHRQDRQDQPSAAHTDSGAEREEGAQQGAGGAATAAAAAAAAGGKGEATPRQLMLFSGYVVHRQIQEHLGPKLALSSSSASKVLPAIITGMLERMFGGGTARNSRDNQGGGGRDAQAPARRYPVLMRGPGGVGCAEVAVMAVPGGGGGSSTDAAAAAAAVTVPQPEGGGGPGASTTKGTDIPLHCALLSVSMPVHVLVDALLSELVLSG